jgi:hypothetical protein
MDETEFTRMLVEYLQKFLPNLGIEAKKTIFYSLYIDELGNIPLNIDNKAEPIRGGGTGFEQDILVFERVQGKTSIVPRVVVEAKFRGVTTHDAMVYSEKAERIRTVYPYIRYGMILEDFQNIPARVLRLGLGFDFILSISNPPKHVELHTLVGLIQEEVDFSRKLGRIFFGPESITTFRRKILLEPGFDLEPLAKKPIEEALLPKQPTKPEIHSGVIYYVYENWRAEDKAKIHYGHCAFCNFGKGIHSNVVSQNGKWHGPFDDYAAALKAAKETGRVVSNCKSCSPG